MAVSVAPQRLADCLGRPLQGRSKAGLAAGPTGVLGPLDEEGVTAASKSLAYVTGSLSKEVY